MVSCVRQADAPWKDAYAAAKPRAEAQLQTWLAVRRGRRRAINAGGRSFSARSAHIRMRDGRRSADRRAGEGRAGDVDHFSVDREVDCQVDRQGCVIRNQPIVCARNVSVKHATSPPCRDRSRQVVIPMQSRLNPKIQPLRRTSRPTCPLAERSQRKLEPCRPMSHFSCSKRRNDDVTLEKFRQSSVAPHIAMGNIPAIAFESVANAHTAADLHVRPVSKTALVSRSWAPRVDLRNTRCAGTRNPFDRCTRHESSHRLPRGVAR